MSFWITEICFWMSSLSVVLEVAVAAGLAPEAVVCAIEIAFLT
jgi:hypothetical protein